MKMMDKFKKILHELNEKDGDDLLWACDVKTTMAKELGMSWAEVHEAIDEHNKQEPNAEIVLWDDSFVSKQKITLFRWHFNVLQMDVKERKEETRAAAS